MMATSEMEAKRQQSSVPCTEQVRTSGPPSYYMTSGPSNLTFGGHGSDPTCYQSGGFMSQTPLLHTNQGPTVMVTQPVVVASAPPPDTTCAFVMTTLSAILCGFWCGALGILLTWKAKLQVLDKKYEHARHSLRIVWLFFSLACLFGAALWTVVGIYLYIVSSFSRRYYYG